jgi:hypothetical protein
MASTYTTNIGIEKPATGDQSGTWGDTTNTNFDIIDQGTNGVATFTLAVAGLPVPLTATYFKRRSQMVAIALLSLMTARI